MHTQELASKYDILKVIGHGGFSAVFKARSKAHPEAIFALKQLDFELEHEDAKEYRDFKEEVSILKNLNHPNIVKVYNEYILDNKPSLEMEFIDGETLEMILKREGCFGIDETLQVIAQIADALQYCHHYHIPDEIASQSDSVLLKRKAIIHNDINPKNIIRTVNNDGTYRYVLLDFGLSFTDPDTVRHSKKEDGMAEYKAPEKWRAETVNTQSDIYSLGIVIYELLTGTVPFPVKEYRDDEEMAMLEKKHQSFQIPDMCEKRKQAMEAKGLEAPDKCDIPDWLELLVEKCLEKDPQQRFTTGRELYNFYIDGINGKVVVPEKKERQHVIDIDPSSDIEHVSQGAYLEVIPNILTEAQHFFIVKDFSVIGRVSDGVGHTADIPVKTADRFISKNHCQIIQKKNEKGETVYLLQDNAPSKNGTYYNTERNTQRLQPDQRVVLQEGDYFWIGNTQIVFHAE